MVTEWCRTEECDCSLLVWYLSLLRHDWSSEESFLAKSKRNVFMCLVPTISSWCISKLTKYHTFLLVETVRPDNVSRLNCLPPHVGINHFRHTFLFPSWHGLARPRTTSTAGRHELFIINKKNWSGREKVWSQYREAWSEGQKCYFLPRRWTSQTHVATRGPLITTWLGRWEELYRIRAGPRCQSRPEYKTSLSVRAITKWAPGWK